MSTWYKTVSVKAVTIGGIVDIVATNVFMIPVVMMLYGGMNDSHLSPAAQSDAFRSALTNNPNIYLAGLFLGSVASILGGWAAARQARRSHLLHGALSSFACIGFGVYGFFGAARDLVPLWQHVAFLVLSPALGAAGGVFRARQDTSILSANASSTNAVRPSIQTTEPLSGARRAIYVANRAVLTVGLFLAVLFGLAGIYGVTQHNPAMIGGSLFFVVVSVASAVLALVGARQLRAGRARHWVYHLGSMVLILIPVAALAIPLLATRSK